MPVVHSQFNPYDDNGGSVVAIGGAGFVVIAADTRLSTGYSIYTRSQNKIFRLTSKAMLACAGCWCDVLTLTSLLEARTRIYLHEHNKEMSTKAMVQMLSTVLYYRRFFPYYISNILAGLDKDGEGWVYSYDPIGNVEQSRFHAGGSSGALLQPLLDNQIGLANMTGVDGKEPVSVEKAVTMVKDVFTSAAERDIYTGDEIKIYILKAGDTNPSVDTFQLRKD